MKKTLFSLILMLAVVANTSAQSWKDLLGKAANEVVGEVSSTETGSIVTNVLGALLGNSLTLSYEALEGTWSYEGVACILESESSLSNIGGSLVTSNIESKIDGMLSKLGVSKGKCSFTFVSDGTCTINVGTYNLSAKYELNASEKIIIFSFLFDKVPVKTYVAYEIQNLNIVFNADKLLALIKNIASSISSKENSGSQQQEQLQNITQTIGAIGALLKNYDGMMLGVKLTRATSTSSAAAATVSAGSSSSAASTNNTTGSTTDSDTKTNSTGSKFSISNLFKK